jgi:nicotinamidase-related amidase
MSGKFDNRRGIVALAYAKIKNNTKFGIDGNAWVAHGPDSATGESETMMTEGREFWPDVLDEETQRLLASRASRPLLGKRPVVVAIDLYELAYAGGPRPVVELLGRYPESCGEFAWQALPNHVALFGAARAAGIHIVHVTYDPFIEADPTHVQPTNRGGRIPEAALYQIKGELKPTSGEPIVYKKRASAFSGTPLIAYLNELRADSLITVGESTSGCLRASVVEGCAYGYPVVVVAECAYDRHDFIHRVSLLDMHLKYVTVISLERALNMMETADNSRTV